MKLLIADDDDFARKLTKILLSKYGDVDIAFNGKMAFDLFLAAHELQEPYDLICLDIMMPVMNGHETLRNIRKCEEEMEIGGLDGVKIIMISALFDSKNVLGAYRDGCEAYLLKPFKRVELIDKIKEFGLVVEST